MDIIINYKNGDVNQLKKGDKVYMISENTKNWRISRKENALTVNFSLSKKDYPTIEEVKEFVKENNCF